MMAVLLAMILSMPGVVVLHGEQPNQQAARDPLAGRWSADMSRSRLDQDALQGNRHHDRCQWQRRHR